MKTRLVVLVGAAVLGCSHPAPPKSITVSMDDVRNQSVIVRDITVAVDESFTIVLGSNRTTPYRWKDDAVIGDPGVVKQVGHTFIHPDSQAMGAPGTESWTFTASKAGTTTIVNSYMRIGVTEPESACTFTANVTVK